MNATDERLTSVLAATTAMLMVAYRLAAAAAWKKRGDGLLQPTGEGDHWWGENQVGAASKTSQIAYTPLSHTQLPVDIDERLGYLDTEQAPTS